MRHLPCFLALELTFLKPVEERSVLSDPGKRRSRRGIVGLHFESNTTTGPEILNPWYCQYLLFVADGKEEAGLYCEGWLGGMLSGFYRGANEAFGITSSKVHATLVQDLCPILPNGRVKDSRRFWGRARQE